MDPICLIRDQQRLRLCSVMTTIAPSKLLPSLKMESILGSLLWEKVHARSSLHKDYAATAAWACELCPGDHIWGTPCFDKTRQIEPALQNAQANSIQPIQFYPLWYPTALAYHLNHPFYSNLTSPFITMHTIYTSHTLVSFRHVHHDRWSSPKQNLVSETETSQTWIHDTKTIRTMCVN